MALTSEATVDFMQRIIRNRDRRIVELEAELAAANETVVVVRNQVAGLRRQLEAEREGLRLATDEGIRAW